MTDTVNNDVQQEQEVVEQQAVEPQADDVQQEGVQRPDGLDDALWDEENNTFNSQALYDHYKQQSEMALGLRKKISAGAHQTGEKLEDYQVELPQDFIDEVGTDGKVELNNDLMGIMQGAFHKAGLSKGSYNDVMAQIVPAIHKLQSQTADDLTPEQKQEAIDEAKREQVEKLGSKATQIMQSASDYVSDMVKDGVVTQEEADFINNTLGGDAQGVGILHKMKLHNSGDTYASDVKASANGWSDDNEKELFRLANTPHNNGDSTHQQIQRLFDMRNRAGVSGTLKP